MIILKNPDNGAPIAHVVTGKEYSLAVGETAPFQDEVGRVLLEIYGFLEEVVIPTVLEKEVVSEVEVKPKGILYKCPYCPHTHEKKIGIFGHIRGNHRNEPKADPITISISGEPDVAGTSVNVVPVDMKPKEGKPVVSLEEKQKKQFEDFYRDASGEGVGVSGREDKDGVEWYGGGVEKDSSTKE